MGRYRVAGSYPVRGRKPGQFLTADLDPREEARHIAAGRLVPAPVKKRPARTTAPTPRPRLSESR